MTLPGYPNPVKLNQSWWCGYGPFDEPSIVVCAVIENGGHGGTAAAPAALKVFEAYFKRTRRHDDASHRLMAIEAVDPRARGLRTRSRDEAVGAARHRPRGSTGCCSRATLAAVAYGVCGDRRDHPARPGRERGEPPGCSTPRSAASCSSPRS